MVTLLQDSLLKENCIDMCWVLFDCRNNTLWYLVLWTHFYIIFLLRHLLHLGLVLFDRIHNYLDINHIMCNQIKHALRSYCSRWAYHEGGYTISTKKVKCWKFLVHVIVMDNDRKFKLIKKLFIKIFPPNGENCVNYISFEFLSFIYNLYFIFMYVLI